jgi:hypothetical protein
MFPSPLPVFFSYCKMLSSKAFSQPIAPWEQETQTPTRPLVDASTIQILQSPGRYSASKETDIPAELNCGEQRWVEQ